MSKLTFNKNGVTHHPLKYWQLTDDVKLAIYQGDRGANPQLDFVVKYLAPNKRLRAISHTHWIVDLLIKSFSNMVNVKDFVHDWIQIYDEVQPFQTIEERNNYEFIYTNRFRFDYEISLNPYGTYKVDFLCSLIELFMKCEKQTPNAFMFKNLLILMHEFCEGKKDFYQVIGHSKRV